MPISLCLSNREITGHEPQFFSWKSESQNLLKRVEVFALDCARRRPMVVAVAMVIDELGIDAQVEKVQDAVEMRGRGVQTQPSLFIAGKLKAAAGS